MAIIEETPITLAEVSALAGESERGLAIKKFIKNFTKMSAEEAKKMKEDLTSLKIMKLKRTHIVKIVDFMPSDATDLNKIISDVSLEQEEINKILDVVKKY